MGKRTMGLEEKVVLDAIAWTLIGTFAAVAAILVVFEAPYGRYDISRGPKMLQNTLAFPVNPKVAWFVQEVPNVVIAIICFFADATEMSFSRLPNNILLLLFTMHYVNRAIIYPLRISKDSAQVPFVISLFAFMFCCINGYLQARSLTMYVHYSSSWCFDPRFIIGCTVFFIGMFVNLRSDSILRSLRKTSKNLRSKRPRNLDSHPSEIPKYYKIPRGFLFEYVSGANFLGEIVEWIGFAIACWSLPGFTIAFCTMCNIGPRAIQHHRWYCTAFPDYPKDRRALIPFIL